MCLVLLTLHVHSQFGTPCLVHTNAASCAYRHVDVHEKVLMLHNDVAILRTQVCMHCMQKIHNSTVLEMHYCIAAKMQHT